MMILVVAIWAMVFGIDPALALIGIALTVFALDQYDPRLMDRFLTHGPE